MWCKYTRLLKSKFFTNNINKLKSQHILTNYKSLTFRGFQSILNSMFERRKPLENMAILLHFCQNLLFQTINTVWCKCGVKLIPVKNGGFSKTHTHSLNKPGLLYRYNPYKHNASMVKWHHTVLVRLNYLVSTGWRHHA